MKKIYILDELKACQSKTWEAESLMERLERLESAMERSTTILTPKIGVNGTQTIDKIGTQVAKFLELQSNYMELLLSLETQISRCEAWVEALPDPHKNVMRFRFLHGLSWSEVAKRTNYCVGHCKKLYKDVLENLEN